MNTSLFQMHRKESWVINMILLIHFLKHNYDVWFENKESTHQKESVDLSDISPLECDEEKVKEGK